MELNPNHPVTQTLHDHWHKIAAFVMQKLGETHVVITAEDIASMPKNMFIVVQELHDGLHVKFVDEAMAQHLVQEHGGLAS